MRDRIVQYPNRYRLVPVSGQTDVFDLEAVSGVITEDGTPLNKANLLTDATATLLGLSNADATVNNAFISLQNSMDSTFTSLQSSMNSTFTSLQNSIVATNRTSQAISRFLTFVSETSSTALDCAFGKSETDPMGVGLALALYGITKDPTKTITNFSTLVTKDSFSSIISDGIAFYQASLVPSVIDLVISSPYAKSLLKGITDTSVSLALRTELNIAQSYTNFASIMAYKPAQTITSKVWSALLKGESTVLKNVATNQSAVTATLNQVANSNVKAELEKTDTYTNYLYVASNTALKTALLNVSDSIITSMNTSDTIVSKIHSITSELVRFAATGNSLLNQTITSTAGSYILTYIYTNLHAGSIQIQDLSTNAVLATKSMNTYQITRLKSTYGMKCGTFTPNSGGSTGGSYYTAFYGIKL